MTLPYHSQNYSRWSIITADTVQGDHSPDNVKFPDSSRHSSTALGMLNVTPIMPVIVLLSVVGVGLQQYMIQNHILNI